MWHDPWTFYQGGKFNLTAEWTEYRKTFKPKDNVDRDVWGGWSIA